MQLQNFLYKLYVFFIPFGAVFNFGIGDIGFWYYLSMSNVVMLIALALRVLEGKRIFEEATKKWINIAAYMIVYSTFCALITDVVWGELNGESPLSNIPHYAVFLLLSVLTVVYNYTSFKYLISFKDLFPIFKTQSAILIVVGLIQYFTINGVGPAIVVEQLLSTVFYVRSPEYLMTNDRGITFFGTEASSAASLCLWLVPFILLYAYYTRKKTYIVQSILWIFLFYNSGSTSNLISFATVLFCLFFVVTRNRIPKVLYYGAFSLGLIMALVYTHGNLTKYNVVGDSGDFSYRIMGKVFDINNNNSTVVRASTVVNDIKVFEEFPLTGIGDGMQGYRFNQNAPSWVLYNPYTQEMLDGSLGIIEGGGNFFPSFLSGYGLIGILILILFLKKFSFDIKRMQSDLLLFNIFSIAVVIFLYSAWYTIALNGYVMFALSLPYAATSHSMNDFISYYFKP